MIDSIVDNKTYRDIPFKLGAVAFQLVRWTYVNRALTRSHVGKPVGISETPKALDQIFQLGLLGPFESGAFEWGWAQLYLAAQSEEWLWRSLPVLRCLFRVHPFYSFLPLKGLSEVHWSAVRRNQASQNLQCSLRKALCPIWFELSPFHVMKSQERSALDKAHRRNNAEKN